MSYPAKRMNLSALLAKLEATYSVAVSLSAATDGHLLALSERAPGLLTLNYEYDGNIGPSPGNLGLLRRVGVLGRTVSGELPMRAKGNGSTATTAAYSATALPNIHTMLRISGFDNSISAGACTYTLTPDSATYGSATMEYYKRGERWSARGVLADVRMEIAGPQVPLWTFDIRGIADTVISDVAVVAPTYPTLTTQEPLAAGMALSIGSYTAGVVRSCSFRLNRDIQTARTNLNAVDLHAGFVPGGYQPELRVVVESTALTYPTSSSGFDPYRLMQGGDDLAVSFTVGTAVNNRYTIAMPQAQLMSFTPQNEGPIATMELVFMGRHSSPIAQGDAVTITWN